MSLPVDLDELFFNAPRVKAALAEFERAMCEEGALPQTAPIVACLTCGQRNRLRAHHATARPVCGACKTPL